MKTTILFSLLMLISTCVTVAAQTESALSKVTLYWFAPTPNSIDAEKVDRSRSSINFETGERGMDGRDYDLRYGGMVLGRRTNRASRARC